MNVEFGIKELKAIGEVIETAPADAAIYLDYEDHVALALPHEDGLWPLETPWRYCFLGFAADLVAELSE